MSRLILIGVLALSACSAPAVESTPVPATAQPSVAVVEPTPAPTEAPPEYLPGLTGGDLTSNLDDKDFECSTIDGSVVIHQCERMETDGHLSAATYGDGQGVRSVTAEAEGSAAEEFIGFIATLPYDGAQPDEARAWVGTNFGSSATATFGVAHFSLSTEGGTTTLSISMEEPA